MDPRTKRINELKASNKRLATRVANKEQETKDIRGHNESLMETFATEDKKSKELRETLISIGKIVGFGALPDNTNGTIATCILEMVNTGKSLICRELNDEIAQYKRADRIAEKLIKSHEEKIEHLRDIIMDIEPAEWKISQLEEQKSILKGKVQLAEKLLLKGLRK